MKCKICGFEITEGLEKCPGCETSIEELKQAGNIEYEIKEDEMVEDTSVKESSSEEKTESKEDVTSVETPEEIKNEESVKEEITIEEKIDETEELPTPIVDDEKEESEPLPESITEVKEETKEEKEDVQETSIEENVSEEVTKSETKSSEPVIMDEFKQEPQEVTGDVTPVITPLPETVNEVENTEVSTTSEQTEEITTQSTAPEVSSTQGDTTEVLPTPEKVETTNTEEMASLDDNKETKKKSKVGLIVIILVAIIVVLLGCVAYIHFVLGSGYNVFSRTLKAMSVASTKEIDESKKSQTSSTKLSFIYSGDQDLDILNKIKLAIETKVDANSGNASVNLGLTYDKSNLDLEAVLVGKDLYLTSKTIYDKTVKVNLDSEEFNELLESYKEASKRTEEVKRVITSVNDYVIKELKDQKYTKEYTNSVFNDKKVNVAKTTLELNKDELTKITKNVLTNIKNDEQLLKDIALLSDESVNDIKEEIEESISSVEYDDVTITVSIYTDMTTLNFYGADVLVKTTESTSTIKVEKINNDYLIKLNVPNVLELVINTNTKKMIITAKEDTTVLTINIEYNVTYSDSINIAAVNGAVDVNDLTDSDIEKITNALINNEVIGEFVSNYIQPNTDLDDDETNELDDDSSESEEEEDM